jgi:hypothetical protein
MRYLFCFLNFRKAVLSPQLIVSHLAVSISVHLDQVAIPEALLGPGPRAILARGHALVGSDWNIVFVLFPAP